MSIVTISKTDFANLDTSKGFTLLCFKYHTSPNDVSLEAVGELLQNIKGLQTFVVKESSLAFFQNCYKFWGTPIYLLFHGNKEVGRLLGTISIVDMLAFLEEHLVEL